MKVIGIGVVVLVIVIAVAYMLMVPGGQQQPTETPVAGGETTQPTTAPTGTQPSGSSSQNESTTTATESGQKMLDIVASMTVEEASDEDKQAGIEYYVTIDVKVKRRVSEKIYIVALYPDKITLTSGHPLVESAYILFDPPEEIPKNNYFKYTYTLNIPSDLASEWAPGTQHTINIVYRIGGVTGEKNVEQVQVTITTK